MAEVWLARRADDPPATPPLVVKTILPNYADSPDFVAMFLNETRVATQLQHPNIVRVFECGYADNCHYIAMEYVVGRTLRQILWRSVQLNNLFPVWFAVEVVVAVSEALVYLHELRDDTGAPLRLLHRDVTPENIMVSFSGEVKLLDFGIARALSSSSQTQAGTFKGKYAYMAPERLELDRPASDVDCRSDLYSLGVVLYECLTGMRPYQAANDAQLLQLILNQERMCVAPSDHARWIPETLDRLVLRCITKNPNERYQAAREMRAALRDFMKDSGLCPTARHLAEQVCGHPDSLTESSPPPSMRLQSPHEIAVRLDSGYHAIRKPDDASGLVSLQSSMRSASIVADAVSAAELPSYGDRRHDWDAAIRRVRVDDENQRSAEMPAVRLSAVDEKDTDVTGREALELLDKSFELVRQNEVEKAISMLRRAAQIDPHNRLVTANLRRLEQLETTSDRARRRG